MPYLKTKEEAELRRPAPGANRGLQSAGAPASTPQPGQGSGDFVNIQQYLDANKEVSDRTAQQLGDTVERDAKGAKAGVDEASDQFRYDAAKGSWTEKRAGEDASTPAYGGPASMAEHRGFADLTTKVQDAQAGVRNTGSGYGLQAHMQDRYGGSGGYTGGQSALDAALTGASGGQRFHQLQQDYGGLQGYLDDANKASSEYGQNAAEMSESARADYSASASASAAARAAEEEARLRAEAEAARQVEQERMGANAGHGDLQESTVSIDDEKAAMNDGLYYEWLKAGSPPYDEWKATKGG